ncbi:MAG: carotenoid biosynthesis protein [Saprospiraceae bacterium]|nr:carotenoid biosynthesis protein [Saprospiraceae bacterium]
MKIYKPLYLSVFIASLFHISGLIGMMSEARTWFISMTPFTLLLMTSLIIWNEKIINRQKINYLILCFSIGFLSEWIGTNTGYLFGDYTYGTAMGFKIGGVPVLIGILWFVTVYSIGQTVLFVYKYLTKNSQRSVWVNFGLINIAAALTTLFDFTLEPAAISLGYWQWLPDGNIPLFNYICWYLISGFLLTPLFMNKSLHHDVNYFAVFLIVLQTLFFIFVV